MEQTNLAKDLTGFGFSGKYILRKTGEEVEVIAFNNLENGARTDEDWVSYIDADGGEHIKERLNIQFDFKTTGGMSSLFERLLNEMPKTDLWEPRRYELAKEFMLKGHAVDERDAVAMADNLIAELEKSLEANEE